MKVAFLGMGRMGRLMASHVLDGGHELRIWNRTPGKAGELATRGAREAATIAEAVSGVQVIVIMLFDGGTVHEAIGEICGHAPEGALIIDATTTGPDAARELAAEAANCGLRYVDAPVAGSLGPAEEGTLTVLVGGSNDDVAEARTLLELWGDPGRIRHLGSVGAGNALKTVVNMCLGIAMAGVGEAMKVGDDLGLDRNLVLDALEAGPFGFTVKQKRKMLASGDYQPATFSLDLMAKDLALAIDSASADLPLTAASLEVAREAESAGHGADDYAVMAGFVTRTD
jgi:3-hydroxyisobutyrate dehydrogenase-like beta-hydroxyacid dehydrogenase